MISNAIERRGFVYVYNEEGRQTATLLAGNANGDGLMGYTPSRVNVRRGSFIYSYDDRGQQLETNLAR